MTQSCGMRPSPFLPGTLQRALARAVMLSLVAGAAGTPLSSMAAAASMPTVAATGVDPAPAAGGQAAAGQTAGGADTATRTYTMTLKQLGANYPMNLRGIDGSNSVPFSVRADEIVTRARLHLDYAYSPALLADLSHLNVMVNGEIAASIALPKENGGKAIQTVVDLPPRLITEFNRLNIQLIGHYTMQCEDPLHSSLWANISNNSQLELSVTALALPDDLAGLPAPFFDRRDLRPLELPVVFASTPDAAQLEAAGTLASWFGALAEYRGARFPASVATLPATGHAVVMLAGDATLPGLDLEPAAGPAVTIVTHPSDPMSKLLVVRGRTAAELKTAATALATGGQTLSGRSATFSQLAQLAPRQPYDAPRWLPSDRPVAFGELATAQALNVSGYSPDLIRIETRLAPDLFGWREQGVPIDLKYRYTPQPTSENSSLLVAVNDQFVKSMPLLSLSRMANGDVLAGQVAADDTVGMETRVNAPLYMMQGQTQLQLRYMYDYVKQGECRDIIIDNVRGAISPESTIDVSAYPHYMALPDLGAFQSSGFPFTRLADLSESAVIMPDNAGPDDFGAYLAVMGRMGQSTGYPATGVVVGRAQDADGLAGRDLIVLGTVANQPLLKRWNDLLPASVDGRSKRFDISDMVYRVTHWLSDGPRAPRETGRTSLSFSSDGANAFFAGFESPLAKGRSVVVVSADRAEGLTQAVDALIGGDGFEETLAGSLAVVRGKDIQSLVADDVYYVGELPVFKRVQWVLSQHPALFAAVAALGAALLVLALYLSLRRRAQRRLSGE